MSATDSNSLTSTIPLPDPTNGSPMTVIIVVIIFLLVVVIIIVIVILLLLRWRTQKRKGGYNNTVSMQVIVAKANNDTNLSGKLEKTAEYENVDIKDRLYSTPSMDGSRNPYDLVSIMKPLSEENVPSDAGVCDDGTKYSNKSLSNNPLYSNIEREMGSPVTGNTITDNVYAKPDFSIASLENTYESIYSVPLHPSHFMQEPEDTENMNDLCPYSSIYTVPAITTLREKALEVSMENIREDVILGSGNFGSVILAHTVGLSHYDLKIGKSTEKSMSVPVTVKMLKDGAGESTKEQFEKEYQFMFHLNHPNVIQLLGICVTETSFIMMEYMENGDLNQFLQHQYYTIVDDETIPREGKITQQMLIHICTQIASAIDYLASNNFVHRDLATRNCLVVENFHVKVSNFGMSHNLYESHYYIIQGLALLPIRWMATECFCGKFSAKSDVWAFGITMWEIFMLAKEEPYYEMSDRDLVQNAIRGSKRLLLSCPESCPHNVYEIMTCCWAHEASHRATFEQLHEKLFSLE